MGYIRYVSEHMGGVGPVVQQCSVKIINIPGNGNTVIEGGYPEAHIYPHKHVINLQIQIFRQIFIQISKYKYKYWDVQIQILMVMASNLLSEDNNLDAREISLVVYLMFLYWICPQFGGNLILSVHEELTYFPRFGAFENLHGHPNPPASLQISKSCISTLGCYRDKTLQNWFSQIKNTLCAFLWNHL